MTDKIDLFLDELKFALERFEPKEGDVFVLSIPDHLPEEFVKRMQNYWEKRTSFPLVAVLEGGGELKLTKKS